MRAARGAFVAFLDDDEIAEADWLAALLATIEATGADVAFGAVVSDFPDGPPAWDPAGRSFNRVLSRPSGSAMGLHHDTSVSGRWIGTGNSLIRVATCFRRADPFDPRFGRCGGEDFDFFKRLDADGRRFVWCPEAVVHEHTPGNRTSLGYMTYRSFRAGQSLMAVRLKNARRPLAVGFDLLARGAAQIVLLVPVVLAAPALPERLRHRGRMRLAEACGRFWWWRLPLSYR